MNLKNSALLILAGALLLADPAAGLARQSGDSIRVVTAPAARPRRNAMLSPRAYLQDELGGLAATQPAAAPDPSVAPRAAGLGLRDAAERAYGEARVSLYRTTDESTAAALVRSIKPAGAQPARVAAGGWSAPGIIAFWVGPYSAVVQGPDHARAALAEALAVRIGTVTAPAPLIQQLPSGSVADSV